MKIKLVCLSTLKTSNFFFLVLRNKSVFFKFYKLLLFFSNADSPILGYNPSVHEHFEVKCILLADYKKFCKETKKLELKGLF